MDPLCLEQCSLYMQTIFKKCPFQEMGKLSKLFCLVLLGLNLPAGSDIPQNKILRGIRPCRTRPCGVSDPAELSLAGYQTPQNNGRAVNILQHTLVLRGLIPRRTMSCKCSAMFCKFEKEFTNIQDVNLGTRWGWLVEKTSGQKSCDCVPLRRSSDLIVSIFSKLNLAQMLLLVYLSS